MSDQNGVFQAFLRNPDGSFETWTGPGGVRDGAFGINIFGTVSGHDVDNSLVNHGFVRSRDGKLTTFEAPGAGTGQSQGTSSPGSAIPINLFGAIAGYYIDANNVVNGFLRSPLGKITTFDVPGAGPYGIDCSADCPVGLNDWGAITGFYPDANNVFHGYLRSPEGKIISFDAPGADLTPGDYNGTYAYSINDAGELPEATKTRTTSFSRLHFLAGGSSMTRPNLARSVQPRGFAKSSHRKRRLSGGVFAMAYPR